MSNQINSAEPYWDVFITRLPAFCDMLSHESERGCVIVGAALLDEALEQILKIRLVPSPEKRDKLFNGAYAPLGSFSAKIDFAYRVGIIGLNRRSILHLIRKLRNDFAHSTLQLSFDSQQVRNRVKELFKLNKPLLDLIWETVDNAQHLAIIEQLGAYKAKHGVDYLVRVMGWKSTFEFLTAMIAASLHTFQGDIKPIVSPDEDKTSS